jgi:hypothetical protein
MFHQLLVAYDDAIGDSSSDFGRTNKLCHFINTGYNPPICKSVCRLSPQKRSENGIIERSIIPGISDSSSKEKG